jgi:hypothetical protein
VAAVEWGDPDRTKWIPVWTYRMGIRDDGEIVRYDDQSHVIARPATEPECTGRAHAWQSDDDAVMGHGGGVIYREYCPRCGASRVTDTWASCPEMGAYGLTSVTYERA